MLILLITSGIIGLIVSGISGYPIAGWIVGAFIFICGLPGALIGGFIHDEVSYSQDRADYRQFMSDMRADLRADEHEYNEDMRTDKFLSSSRKDKL